jgi:hypothetical protein
MLELPILRQEIYGCWRMVGKPYVGITSRLPVLRPELQIDRRSWRQLSGRFAGLGKILESTRASLVLGGLLLKNSSIYATLV